MFSHSKQTILRFNFNSCQTAHTPNWVARKNNNNTEKNNARIHGHWLMCVWFTAHALSFPLVCVRAIRSFLLQFDWGRMRQTYNTAEYVRPFSAHNNSVWVFVLPVNVERSLCMCACILKIWGKQKHYESRSVSLYRAFPSQWSSTMNSTNAYVFLKKMFDAIKNWQSLHILFVS